MIIKLTLNDNDFTEYIESFLKRFKFQNYYIALEQYDSDNEEDVKAYVKQQTDMEHLLDKIHYKEYQLTKFDIKQFEKYVKEALAYYLYKHHTLLSNDLEDYNKWVKVKCLKSMNNKWHNDEVVYYFLQQDKYIIC